MAFTKDLKPAMPPVEGLQAADWEQYFRSMMTEEIRKHQEKTRKLEEESIHNRIDKFADKCTAHGFGPLYVSRGWFRRGVWLVVCVVMVSWGAYQNYKVIAEYLTYPKKVSIGVEEDKEVLFPGVTVCNLNPLPCKDHLQNSTMWKGFVEVQEAYGAKECDDTLGYFTPYEEDQGTEEDNTVDTEGTDETEADSGSYEDSSAARKKRSCPCDAPKTPREMIQFLNFENFTKMNEAMLLRKDHRSTDNDTVKEIRMACTGGYYRYLTYLNTDEATDEDAPLTFTDSTNQICRKTNYTIDISYTILCQVIVFCDNFGCFDTKLKDFRITKTNRDNSTFYCSPSCSDDCWPLENFINLQNTETTIDEVQKVFNNSHSPDFSDVIAIYTPSSENLGDCSVPADKFINICSHEHKKCTSKQFHTWTSDRYGMCYTYNSAFHKIQLKNKTEVNDTPKKTSLVGPTYGLRLTINIHKHNYVALLSQEVGLRVIVHSPYQLPFPEDEGFNVSPGVINSIKVSRKKLERVGPPHGLCKSESDSDIFTEYSSVRCKKMCVERELWRTCGCFVGSSPAYHSKTYLKPKEPCDQFNISQRLCIEMARFSYQRGLLSCDCPSACSETAYEAQVTSTKENKDFFYIIQNMLKWSMGSDLCSNENETVRIHLYLDSLTYESIQESPSISWDTLISNFGGNLGLFIGMSLVTTAEFLEFIVDVVILGLQSRQNRKKSSESTVTPIQSVTSSASPRPGNWTF